MTARVTTRGAAVLVLMAFSPCSADGALAGQARLPDHATPTFTWPAAGLVDAHDCGGRNSGSAIAISISLTPSAEIYAADGGQVAYAGPFPNTSKQMIVIRHGKHWISEYELPGQATVKRGDAVKRGQIIAESDASNPGGKLEMYFALKQDSKPVNPLAYLPSDRNHPRMQHYC